MNKRDKQLNDDMQGIQNLINYAEEYPKGAVKIGYHYYNVSALIESLQDIKIRSSLGAETKTDRLMMQILAGVY